MNDQPPPPPVRMLQMLIGGWVAQSIYVAAKLGLADLVASGPKTAAELAKACDANADALYRLLRALASVGVFTEVQNGRFAMTPLAETLKTGHGTQRAMAIMTGEEHQQAWTDILYSIKTGKPSFDHVFGMGVFDFFQKNPAAGETFNQAMSSFAVITHAGIAEGYDYSGIRKLVDVGGGHGSLMTAILKKNPKLTGVVYDRPNVVDGARKTLEQAGLTGRCEVVAGDFLESVPSGADGYILSHILHDWDDERCRMILKNIHKSMEKSGRVLIAEHVIAPGNDPSPGKFLDLNMLVMCPGGRERTEAEFKTLVASAGFKLSRVVPLKCPESVVEVVRA